MRVAIEVSKNRDPAVAESVPEELLDKHSTAPSKRIKDHDGLMAFDPPEKPRIPDFVPSGFLGPVVAKGESQNVVTKKSDAKESVDTKTPNVTEAKKEYEVAAAKEKIVEVPDAVQVEVKGDEVG